MSRIFKALERAEADRQLRPGSPVPLDREPDRRPAPVPPVEAPARVLRPAEALEWDDEAEVDGSRSEHARLKVMLGLAARGADLKSVMLLSARPGEGVSTVALGLAQELAAGASHGVLLVETRAGHSDLADLLEVDPAVGLSELLAKSVSREDAIVATSVPRLFFLGRGQARADLSQARWVGLFEELLGSLRTVFDAVIIDGGSIEECADSLLLARAAEGVVVVVDSRHTSSTAARRATQSLRVAGANLVGVVLNRHRKYVPGFLTKRM
jgi:Mrp family chromosome partitioning ATPase